MDSLPNIPETLLNEYKTFAGGAFGKQTYDYYGNSQPSTNFVPRSFFEFMEKEKREAARGTVDHQDY